MAVKKYVCQECGKVFDAARSDAKVCSNACRLQKSLNKRAIINAKEMLLNKFDGSINLKDELDQLKLNLKS